MAKLNPPQDPDNKSEQSRRTFVKGLGQSAAALGLGGPVVFSACGRDGSAESLDILEDGLGGDAPRRAMNDSVTPDPGPVLEVSITITKGPWVMPLERGGVAIRFETAEEIDVPVGLNAADTQLPPVVATRAPITYTTEVPVSPLVAPDEVIADEKGTFWVQTVIFAELVPDTLYTWTVPTGPDSSALTGSFRTLPVEPKAITLAWIADTMWPNTEDTAPLVASMGADLVLHGGDVQYESGLVDSWNTYFDIFKDVFRSSLVTWCVGNHEFEWGDGNDGEYTQYFLGLLSPPDDAAPAPNYRRLTVGQLAVFEVDSEADYEQSLDDPEGAQRQWLERELAIAAADPAIKTIIVAFHRPYLCFGKSGMRRDRMAWMHPLMVEHRVALVLCGHNHAYERFERDGVAYCTDGGGGALTYSVTKQIDEGKISDEELSWRQAAEESFGALKIDVAEDGTLNLSRYRASSREVVETFAVAPRS